MGNDLRWPEGNPVTNAESTVLRSNKQQTLADVYLNPFAHNVNVNGPFEQTLFLGCSVVNFNTNLGWGAENSTLTVTLVEDDSYHWNDPLAQYNTNRMRSYVTTPASYGGYQINPGGSDGRPGLNTVGPNTPVSLNPNSYPGTVGPTGYDLSQGTTMFPNIPTNPWDSTRVDFFRNIFVKEIAIDNQRKEEQAVLYQLNRGDFGKVYYEVFSDGRYIKKYWTKPDPGFVGKTYDIFGTAVRFIFGDFEFTGLVSSWKKNAGKGGYNQYTVEIKSFASLLSNTQLIIDHYAGSIFTKLKESDSSWPEIFSNPFYMGTSEDDERDVTGLGLPSNDTGSQQGKYGSVDFIRTNEKPENKTERFVGNIKQGNLTNVFNVYGYIESTVGFGKNDVNELGTKITDIYGSIQDLVNYSPSYDTETGLFKIESFDTRFSPYGRIIGKAPALTKLPTLSPNIESGTFNVLYLQDTYKIVQPSSVPLYYVKENPIPDAYSAPFYFQTLEESSQKYQAQQGYRLNEAGVIPVQKAKDGVLRQHYTLDLSKLPPIPSGDRIKGPVISVTDLVQHVCDQANYDWFVDFNHINNQITIKTISRQKQPANNYIEHLVLSSAGSSSITSYDYGLEFNDSATVRSVYIGPKQKRLLQVCSNFLANKNTALAFDPWDSSGFGSLLMSDINKIKNIVRIPDHFSTRNLLFPYYDEIYHVGNPPSSGTGAIIWEEYYRNFWSDGQGVGGGNYLDPIEYVGPNSDVLDNKGGELDIFRDLGNTMYNKYTYLGDDQKNGIKQVVLPPEQEEETEIVTNSFTNYPLWDEFICPYFGLDSDGTARKVFYDTGMRQLQLLCSIGDLQNALGFKLTSAIDFGPDGLTTTPWQNPDVSGSVVSGGDPNPSTPLPYDSNNPISVGQSIGANLDQATSIEERNLKWNINKRSYYDFNAKFLVTENEIRSAIAGFDSWMFYTFNKEFTTDLGNILRKTIFAQSGNLVQSRNANADQVNAGIEYPVNLVFNGSNVAIVSDTSSESPNTAQSDMLKDKIRNALETAHNYIKDIGTTYYGKQYMVKVPGLSVSRDRSYVDKSKLTLKLHNKEFNINEYEAGGKYYTNYKPASDGAWEEPGNVIDDCIVIGSVESDFFRNEDGRFGAMLGFNASYEFLSDTIDEQLLAPIGPAIGSAQEVNEALDAAILSVDPSIYPNYVSRPSGSSPGGKTGREIKTNLPNQQAGSPEGSDSIYPKIPSVAMLYATSSQPATGTDIIPNEFYPSIVTSLESSDYLYYEYNNQYQNSDYPIDKNIPSFAKVNTTSHNRVLPDNLKYKLYAKASLENNFIFINALGAASSALRHRPEGRELRAVVSLGSEIVCNPVHLVDKFVGHALQLDSALYKKEGATIPYIVAGPSYIEQPKVLKEESVVDVVKSIVEGYSSDDPIDLTNVLTTSQSEGILRRGTVHGGMLPFKGGFGFGGPGNIVSLVTDNLLRAVNSNYGSNENKAFTMPIASKAAMPGFAAVPLESQGAVYGPWTNQPVLLSKEIFSDKDLQDQPAALWDSIENLVGGLKVEVAEDLAPWQFGGMNALDAHVISKIQNDAAYQLQIEQGTIDIPGLPSYKLGDFLDKASNYSGGPIINNISANIDRGGIATKYSFRTFNKKFSMYNKENADRLAKLNTESIKRRREIALRSAVVTNNRAQNVKRQNLNNYGNTDYVNPPMAVSWRSASELLVGHNELSFRLPPVLSEDATESVALTSGILKIFDYDVSWGFHPACRINPGLVYNANDYPKIFSQSKIMDSREAGRVLSSNYENTSCMSLDGLLSPISFYPTENFSTYHITKYDRKLCRYCLGRGRIKYKDPASNLAAMVFGVESESESESGSNSPSGIETLSYTNQKNTSIEKYIDCPFCEPINIKISGILQSSKNGRKDPPFIVTSGTDTGPDTNAYRINSQNYANIKSNSALINYSTLNPIVMSHGEFSVFANRASGDYTANSIKMVGIGSLPPDGPNDSLNQQMCGENRLIKSYLEYDQIYLDKIKRLYELPLDQRTPTIKSIMEEAGSENPIPFSNNARFFGWRGPIMVHGWGYDTEGYPVPNASGDFMMIKKPEDDTDNLYQEDEELKDIEGLFYKAKAKKARNGEVIFIYQNQKFVNKEDLTEDQISELDDQGIEWVSFTGAEGYFTEPYKEKNFARGWGHTPSTWPVGPIDLRWDEGAKVWTVPSTYRNVYILLEEDLKKSTEPTLENKIPIARGEIVDNNQDIARTPFGLGYRKTVYVRDPYGVYAAPRSALIYCAYDPESGYYEPVSQNAFSTSGTIISSNTASISKIYKRKTNTLSNNNVANDEDLTFVASFTNPLDIPIDPGDVALFGYYPDGWVVQNTRG